MSNLTASNEEHSLFNENVNNVPEALVEQYKLYVESANLTTTIRSQANTFFLSINTVLIGFIVGLVEFIDKPTSPWWMIFACLTGVLLSVTWFVLLQSYRNLNSGRFAVIHELEEHLPARIYTREWEIIRNRPKRPYFRLTRIEQIIPLIFAVLYILIALALILVD